MKVNTGQNSCSSQHITKMVGLPVDYFEAGKEKMVIRKRVGFGFRIFCSEGISLN